MIKLKRIYDQPEESDGIRILVDRIWPRGISKEKANLDYWLKQIGPSTELRKWFHHDPKKFMEFKERYIEELSGGEQQEMLMQLKELVDNHPTITLLYAAKSEQYNQAVVLKEILEA